MSGGPNFVESVCNINIEHQSIPHAHMDEGIEKQALPMP